MRDRYVLLGLAPARAEWFRQVAQWSSSAVLPAEFLRCVSVEEVRARLASGRPFSALLVDASVPGLDRDLLLEAVTAGVAVLVVDDVQARDWRALGAAARLRPPFSRDELLEVLGASATMVGPAALDPADAPAAPAGGVRGDLVVVTGPGGTGASTLAIALAQGLAAGARVRPGRRRPSPAPAASVLLADLCRYADQAMLHDARVLVPGLQELVEAHRTCVPDAADVLDQTFDVPARGYRLVLGLRRPRHWVTLRPRAVETTIDSLQRLVDVVVADVEAELDGEAETGSLDVEERNLLARTAVSRASAVVLVGEPSMKGMHALVRTFGEIVAAGVPAARVLPVVNRAPRRPRARAELTRTLAELLRASVGLAGDEVVAPLHVPARPVDEALRDGVALPAPLPASLARAVTAVLDRAGGRPAVATDGPAPVVPGTLGTFTPSDGAVP